MKGRNPVVHGDFQLTVEFAGAAENQQMPWALLIQPAQLTTGRGLEAVYQRRQGSQDRCFRVGLGGIEQLAVGGQRFTHVPNVLLQRDQIIDVSTERCLLLLAQLADGLGDACRQTHERALARAVNSGLGRAV